jgi:hypothetical protein
VRKRAVSGLKLKESCQKESPYVYDLSDSAGNPTKQMGQLNFYCFEITLV